MNLQFAKLLEIMPDLNLMLLALSAMNKMNSLGGLKKGEGRGLGISVHLGLHFRCIRSWVIQILCNFPLHYDEKGHLLIALLAN